MPFKSVEEAVKKHPNLDKYSAKAKRGWLKSFNNAFEQKPGDEGYAFAVAYSVANKIDGKKAASKEEMIFASEDEALQYLSDITGERIVVAGVSGWEDVLAPEEKVLIEKWRERGDSKIKDMIATLDELNEVFPNKKSEGDQIHQWFLDAKQEGLLNKGEPLYLWKLIKKVRQECAKQKRQEESREKWEKEQEEYMKRYEED